MPKRKFIPAQLIALSCLVLIFAAVGIFFAVRQTPEDDMIKLNVIIKPSLDFNNVLYFYEGLAAVATAWPSKYGYIDMTGEIVIECKYDWGANFADGLASVLKNGKWGFIDKTGEEVIPLEYDYAGSFYNGLARVHRNGKSGYIDKSGKVEIFLEYDDARDFIYEAAAVCKKNKWGLIDINGNTVVPIEYSWIDYFNYGGLFAVYKNSKCGLVDKAGNFILDCIYDEINFDVNSGLIYVKSNGKWGILEIDGYEPDPNANSYRAYWNGQYYY